MRLRFVKHRFMRYRFIRYWFRLVSRPWLDTDIPSKHFVCLQDVFKMSSRRYQDMPSMRLQDMLSRRLQDVFSITIFRLPIRLEDVFKTSSRRICKTSSRRLQDILEDKKLLRWRHVEDVFKTCLQDVLKTYQYLLGLLPYSIKLYIAIITSRCLALSICILFISLMQSVNGTQFLNTTSLHHYLLLVLVKLM